MYSTIIHYKINDILGFGVHQSEDPTDGVILLRHTPARIRHKCAVLNARWQTHSNIAFASPGLSTSDG